MPWMGSTGTHVKSFPSFAIPFTRASIGARRFRWRPARYVTMPLSLEEAIAHVPMWAGATDLTISVLAGGITNRNFRVTVRGESFVLRVSAENTELLGINR